jgi:branched-chain amino acid transport system ATP-binding protein
MSAALEIRGLSVHFGGLVALDAVSLEVETGTILGVIGPNGAGKSTLFDAISGLVPAAGTVHLGGVDVTALSPHGRARRGLGRSFQDGRLFPSLTVAEAIGVALWRHIPADAPFSALVGGPLARGQRRRARQRVGEVVELMGLEPYAEAFVRELSTGTRRLVDLACAVAHEPSVLLLDEPSSGIAQSEVGHLGSLIGQVRERTGCTILLIEHDIPLVTSVSDELVALETGRVLRRGSPAEVTEDPAVLAAYLGREGSVDAAG